MNNFETQARQILNKLDLDLSNYIALLLADPSITNKAIADLQLGKDEISAFHEALASLVALHQAELERTEKQAKPLDKAERWEYERFKHERVIAIEDYHEFGKAPVGSPERMAAYISYLSLHNLKQGAEVLKQWRDEAIERAQATAYARGYDDCLREHGAVFKDKP